jgi:hypothetical protein
MMRYTSMIDDSGCMIESIILPFDRDALMMRESTISSKAIQPQSEPIRMRIIGRTPVARINAIARIVPPIEPNAFHNDFAYPARNSVKDEYIWHCAISPPLTTLPL